MARNHDDKLLTIEQVAELIGFSVSTIYAGDCETDQLIRVRFKSPGASREAIRFSYLNVQGWIASHLAQARNDQPAPSPLTKANIDDVFTAHQLKLVKK